MNKKFSEVLDIRNRRKTWLAEPESREIKETLPPPPSLPPPPPEVVVTEKMWMPLADKIQKEAMEEEKAFSQCMRGKVTKLLEFPNSLWEEYQTFRMTKLEQFGICLRLLVHDWYSSIYQSIVLAKRGMEFQQLRTPTVPKVVSEHILLLMKQFLLARAKMKMILHNGMMGVGSAEVGRAKMIVQKDKEFATIPVSKLATAFTNVIMTQFKQPERDGREWGRLWKESKHGTSKKRQLEEMTVRIQQKSQEIPLPLPPVGNDFVIDFASLLAPTPTPAPTPTLRSASAWKRDLDYAYAEIAAFSERVRGDPETAELRHGLGRLGKYIKKLAQYRQENGVDRQKIRILEAEVYTLVRGLPWWTHPWTREQPVLSGRVEGFLLPFLASVVCILQIGKDE